MTNDRVILLIGRSGRGKSALANVITNANDFKESCGSVSETRKIQLGKFREERVVYTIIDTPGIGDTKMSDNEVLDIIAEAVYLAKNGISQVFFVNDGRFDQYEMATYDLLRTIIFDQNITKYTTIVRTHFPEFRDEDEWQADIELMIKETRNRKIGLEQNIFIKRKELTTLSSDSARYQQLFDEIERVKKELVSTNLAEIIESCQKRIVYVDNPPIEIENDDRLKMNKEDRSDSREILLKHLSKNCQDHFYKPSKLQALSNEIADDFFQYLKKKEELQKELEKLGSEIKVFTSKSSEGETNLRFFSQEESDTLDVKKEEERQIEDEDKIGIIEISKAISQLNDKKERLKKEIQEKERVIRQKVLKHIFNNYQEINQELGGDIFLNNVIGNNNWTKINKEFINKELVVKWLSNGFDYQQTKDWVTVLKNSFDPKIDAGFVAWMRDIKKLTVEKVKNSYSESVEQLRIEYISWLKKETELLDHHNQQLGQKGKYNKWTDINEDFAKRNYWGKTYQQEWEEREFTCLEAQAWVQSGLDLGDYNKAKQWKEQGFNSQQVAKWIKLGLETKDAEFATYLKGKGYQTNQTLDLEKLRREFTLWLERNKLAQSYLDYHYSPTEIKTVKKIDIRYKNLVGSLDLSDFANLEELYCSHNQLTVLKLNNCLKLRVIYCWDNQLSQLDLTNCRHLERLCCSDNYLQDLVLISSAELLIELNIRNNNFSEQNLLMFRRFVNLEKLEIGSIIRKSKNGQNICNRFIGSLEPLQNLRKLKYLDISNTDIDSGLEYLPDSIEVFYCLNKERSGAKCQAIYNLFADEKGKVEEEGGGSIADFPQKLKEYKQSKNQNNSDQLSDLFRDERKIETKIEILPK